MLQPFALTACLLLIPVRAFTAEADFFEARIRPLLIERCAECHGPEKQKGGLRVDSREALLVGGESGPAVVPGEPDLSLLLNAVRHTAKDLQMPPPKAGKKLDAGALADLATWVKAGAVWPAETGPAAPAAKAVFDLEARKKRLPWIWQTPHEQPVPVVTGPAPTDVDRFILAKLEEKGLTPAPPADSLTWLRRVQFALTGLPPQREEMQAFLADTSPQQREHTVDRLLASPHYGERWARHWMDLVRYAESRGHESDFAIANAWRYRDYLIRAFNADVPFDQFVREHVAGDLVPPRRDPATGGNESVLATGWAFLGEENHSPVDIRQDECDRVDNKVDVLSKTLLGLTVACARCHDHKFDAITQKDYYALSGFILGSPFRQVRYETMEAHARAAEQLAEIRQRHAAQFASAFARAARPGLEQIAGYLLAAAAGATGESPERVTTPAASLTVWQEQLRRAADARHPLHAFAVLAGEPGSAAPAPFAERLARGAGPRLPCPRTCRSSRISPAPASRRGSRTVRSSEPVRWCPATSSPAPPGNRFRGS